MTLEVMNVDHAPHAALAQRLLVRSLPTLITLRDEKPMAMLVGRKVLEWEPCVKDRDVVYLLPALTRKEGVR